MVNAMNVMTDGWLAELLSRNNISDIGSLTPAMIFEEIDDSRGTIGNEKIWALGSKTKSSAAMHFGNIENLEEYIEFLETLLPKN